MLPRVVLLVTSPRLPAGLLTAQAWDLIRAHSVYAAGVTDQSKALGAGGGVDVTILEGETPSEVVQALLSEARERELVVWLAGPTGDPEVARELGRRLTAQPGVADMEVLYGSWDPPGARLLDVVTVMDKLRSPGGCPWDAEQTHESLAHYLLEEAYEAYDVMVAGDAAALREELGDVLLQVAFHARIAAESDPGWSIDDVAGDLVDKLVRRHPHVFGTTVVNGAAEVHDNWEQIKRAEKGRSSATEGIALSQPALALAAKLISRAARAGLDVPVPAPVTEPTSADDLGATLLALVADAHVRGIDPEAALRAAALAHADAIRATESAEPA